MSELHTVVEHQLYPCQKCGHGNNVSAWQVTKARPLDESYRRGAEAWAKSQQATVATFSDYTIFACHACRRNSVTSALHIIHAHDCDAAIILDLEREGVR